MVKMMVIWLLNTLLLLAIIIDNIDLKWASLVAQLVKNLPVVWETWV